MVRDTLVLVYKYKYNGRQNQLFVDHIGAQTGVKERDEEKMLLNFLLFQTNNFRASNISKTSLYMKSAICVVSSNDIRHNSG